MIQAETRFARFLNWVERAGNKLPDPVALFFWLFCFTVALSAVLAMLGISVTYQAINAGEVVDKTATIKNMLTSSGIRDIFTSGVKSFVNHPALGSVVVAMLGVGIAEGSGLIRAVIKKVVLGTPKFLVSYMVVFAGVMSNIASDAGYVVLVPLGAIVFLSFGRHPLAGIAAAFAGVSGGFSANLLIGTIDPLLGGISTSAAQIMISGYSVAPTANYFFMAASTVLVTILGALITDKIVEPRLGPYHGSHEVDTHDTILTPEEKRGLRYAGWALIGFLGAILLLTAPEGAILKMTAKEIADFTAKQGRAPETLEILKPFFSDSIVFIFMLLFFITGYAYGLGAKTIKCAKDVAKFMNNAMASMASVVVILFISAQFIYVFNQSNIGIVIAVELAGFLKELGVTGVSAVVGLIFISAFANLFMGSASAKWLVLSPVFVPLFIQLGISPELTQAAYRVGDSTTNIITPLMTYFPIILTFMAKYQNEKDGIGFGSAIALMLPYSLIFLGAWTLFFIAWVSLGIPVGPGVENFLSIL